jgi:hypothetical protein
MTGSAMCPTRTSARAVIVPESAPQVSRHGDRKSGQLHVTVGGLDARPRQMRIFARCAVMHKHTIWLPDGLASSILPERHGQPGFRRDRHVASSEKGGRMPRADRQWAG